MDETAIGAIIRQVGEWVSASAGYMATFANTVVSQPVLLLTVVAVPLVGTGIGLFKRAKRA